MSLHRQKPQCWESPTKNSPDGRCVEPCRTYTVGGNPQTRKLELQLDWGKCLHYYFYQEHPQFGLMHLRLQTWFPFLINICLNRRQWLARQMTKEGQRGDEL